LFPNQNIGKNFHVLTRQFVGSIPEDNHFSAIKNLPTNIFAKKGLATTKHFTSNIRSKDHLVVAR
jgi:hypothetical protein